MLQPHTPTALSAAAAPRPGSGQVLAADPDWPIAQRLVVLVPPNITDEVGLATRIYAAAQARRIAVLYLGLVPRPEDEPTLRRRLALLAACTRDNHAVWAEYRLAVGADWLAWLALAWRPGDLVICHAEQLVRSAWAVQPLAYVLIARLGRPVVMLAGFCRPTAAPAQRAARYLAFWTGALALVAAFFFVQVNIQGSVSGAAQPLLLALSVAGEFGALAAWNRWLG